jgi:hypothetical protein
LWCGEPDAISNAVEYPKFFSRSHHAVIRVYDEADNVIETDEHARATSKRREVLYQSPVFRGRSSIWPPLLRHSRLQ